MHRHADGGLCGCDSADGDGATTVTERQRSTPTNAYTRLIRSLRPCPFCGQRRLSITGCGPDDAGGPYEVECTRGECNAVGPVRDTQRLAVDAWNGVGHAQDAS